MTCDDSAMLAQPIQPHGLTCTKDVPRQGHDPEICGWDDFLAPSWGEFVAARSRYLKHLETGETSRRRSPSPVPSASGDHER